MSPRLISLDLETTTPEGVEADFEDLSVWRPFAVAVGFRSGHASPVQSEVFIRNNRTVKAERRMYAQLVNWIRDREPIDGLITYNGGDVEDGTGFDLPIIGERADAVARSDRYHEDTLAFAVYDTLDAPHRDLFVELKERMDEDEKWPSLDDALAERGIRAAEPELDGESVTGGMMPDIGRSVLSESIEAETRDALVAYAESDVRPLFELADRLDRERQSPAEADAATDGGRR